MPYEIFISYRRKDTAGHARGLHRALTEFFEPGRIFFDRETIESGEVFPELISTGVRDCHVLLALIAPDWLNAGPDGRRRLDDPTDFVRREIALALNVDKKVIPVLFDDTPVPDRQALPHELRSGLAELVWFREGYMPDWLLEALLARLDRHNETRTRQILLTMLATVVTGSDGEIPLRIATAAPSVKLSRWRAAWDRLRARTQRGITRELLRKAPLDSPLHDYVFLRFLSGQFLRKLDLTAPGALAQRLRSIPAVIPAKAAMLALALCALAIWHWPPWLSGTVRYVSGPMAFDSGAGSGAFVAYRVLVDKSGQLRIIGQALNRVSNEATTWTSKPAVVTGAWVLVSQDASRTLVARAGALWVTASYLGDKLLLLEGSQQMVTGNQYEIPFDRTAALSENGNRVAVVARDRSDIVWQASSGESLRRF